MPCPNKLFISFGTYKGHSSLKASQPYRMFRYCYALLLVFFAHVHCCAQDCSQATNNQLCADDVLPEDTLSPIPFTYGCFDNLFTYFYTFHTNSVANLYGAEVIVTPIDCDNPAGPDLISLTVIQLQNNGDPCNQNFYLSQLCAQDFQEFSLQLTTLLPDQDYIIVVGSDHDPNYGPCQFSVDIEGDAVDLVATASPPYITLGESSQLEVVGQDTTIAVNWSDPQYLDNSSSTTPIATPDGSTAFVVTGQVDGCVLTDVVTLELGPPITIYNTFTPNGDGINDVWTLGGIQRFPNCQISVFDRWGQNIFKSTSYAKPWDGTYKGNYLPTAAYYYVIELNSLEVNIPPITGTISIVH